VTLHNVGPRLLDVYKRQLYGANNTPAGEVWANGTTTLQTETWNANGTINNVDYFGITGQAYTSEDVVYGANNKPAEATYSNGMTDTYSYNADGTLHEQLYEGITGQKYSSTDTLYGANNTPASEVWANGTTTLQTENWNPDGSINNIDYFGIAGQAYTSEDVVYGANNKAVEATYSNGMTDTFSYNADGTPVSYTHLDVYKRQGRWVLMSPPARLVCVHCRTLSKCPRSLLAKAKNMA